MKKLLTAIAMLGLTAAPAFSGVYFTTLTTGEGGKSSAGIRLSAQGWVDGNKARVQFGESNVPLFKRGSFLLTNDGGATVNLVDPKEQTFSKWDLDPVLGLLAAAGVRPSDDAKSTFSEPRVENLAEKDGGEIAGVATRYYHFRTSFKTQPEGAGPELASSTVIEEEIWAAPKLTDAALGIWLRHAATKTGNEKVDALVSAEQAKYPGFPLKRVVVTTTTDGKGVKSTSTLSTAVTQLIVGDIPANTFAMGPGYRETPLRMASRATEKQNPPTAEVSAADDQRYPFDRMIDNPPADQGDQPAAQPEPAQPDQAAPRSQPGQPGYQPQPGTQPQPGAQPVQPEPTPVPGDEPEPPYPFERMLDTPS